MDNYGPEADCHLFRCLVSSVDFANEGRNSGKEQLQLLIKEAGALVTKPDFVSILCYAFEKQESKVHICLSIVFSLHFLSHLPPPPHTHRVSAPPPSSSARLPRF